jgi:hypothetical protein
LFGFFEKQRHKSASDQDGENGVLELSDQNSGSAETFFGQLVGAVDLLAFFGFLLADAVLTGLKGSVDIARRDRPVVFSFESAFFVDQWFKSASLLLANQSVPSCPGSPI